MTGEVTALEPRRRRRSRPSTRPPVQLLELMATRIGPRNFPAELRYDDASWVGYRLAELLPLPLSIKQSMLEINDALVSFEVLQQFLTQQGLI